MPASKAAISSKVGSTPGGRGADERASPAPKAAAAAAKIIHPRKTRPRFRILLPPFIVIS
jgi:hypothetical protein